MPFTTQTLMCAYDLPADGPVAHSEVIALIDSAKVSLRAEMYGFTDPAIVDAIGRAYERIGDVKLILDHSQSTGPSEVAQLHRLVLQVPPVNIAITTSPLHQIMHRKVCLIDGNATVPDAQYTTLADAQAGGYPITIIGSTNWSPTGFRQTNDLLIFPGKAYAAIVWRQFDILFAWAMANEPAYQTLRTA